MKKSRVCSLPPRLFVRSPQFPMETDRLLLAGPHFENFRETLACLLTILGNDILGKSEDGFS